MTENTENNISELLVFLFAVGGVSQNLRDKIFPFAYPTDLSNLISTFLNHALNDFGVFLPWRGNNVNWPH